MDHVGIVPNALGRQRLSSDQHAVDVITGQLITTDQGTLVLEVFTGSSDGTGGAARIIDELIVERVDVDIDRGTAVVVDAIINDDRL